mgnify:CR=1 FL=1
MRTIVLATLTAGVILAAAGCAHNPIVGDGAVRSDLFYGDVGITGNGATVTIQRGSKVHKLSVIGNDCNITVEDGVTMYKIEFWGKNNTVSLPDDLVVHTTQVGANQIIRRPRQPRPATELEESAPVPWPPATIPPAEPQPAPITPNSEVERDSTIPAADEFPYSPPPTIRPGEEVRNTTEEL